MNTHFVLGDNGQLGVLHFAITYRVNCNKGFILNYGKKTSASCFNVFIFLYFNALVLKCTKKSYRYFYFEYESCILSHITVFF